MKNLKKKRTWILLHYARKSSRIYSEVAEKAGVEIKNEPMTPEFAAAMHSAMNIGVGSSRIMNRFITAHFGYRIMPAENRIFRDGELTLDSLPPEVKDVVMEDGKIFIIIANHLIWF